VSTADPALTRETAVEIARLLSDDKCEEILLLDVQSISQLCDYLIIASGTSDRQMRSAADEAVDLAQARNTPLYRRNIDDRTTWVVLDFVDIMVHIFEPNTRAHYDLEMLWGDAARIEWERPGDARRDHARLGG
jgi:ribosome-associated protein